MILRFKRKLEREYHSRYFGNVLRELRLATRMICDMADKGLAEGRYTWRWLGESNCDISSAPPLKIVRGGDFSHWAICPNGSWTIFIWVQSTYIRDRMTIREISDLEFERSRTAIKILDR
jgi:hypothetical protein